MQTKSTLGELILTLYDLYREIYDDDDIASVAAAATVNELLAEAATDDPEGALAA